MSSTAIKAAQDYFHLTKSVICQLGLEDDELISLEVAEVEIELAGCMTKHPETDAQSERLISGIHADKIKLNLDSIVQNVLAYYALAEQPLGTNEPAIGPVFAQQLFEKMNSQSVNMMRIKDELSAYLNRV